MTPIEKFLSEVEARAKAATGHEWLVDPDLLENGNVPIIRFTEDCPLDDSQRVAFAMEDDDAIFIAASRTDVPTLVECLRKCLSHMNEIAKNTDDFGTDKVIQSLEARIGRRG